MDAYTRRSRLYPAFLVALPISILVVVLAPTTPDWWVRITGVLAASGFPVLAAQFGRGAGRRREPELFASWGGKPSTILLRHRRNPNPVALDRRHRQLERIDAHLILPSAQAEESDPLAADATYEAATEMLREATRDHKAFPLVFDELCDYGFRRNLWAHRTLGAVLCAVSILGTTGSLIAAAVTDVEFAVPGLIAVLAIDALTLWAWRRLVTLDWVKEGAFAYAERLIASTDRI